MELDVQPVAWPSQRRRSSAAQYRPAAPPPTAPIPRIPDERPPTLPSPNLAAVAAFSQSRLAQYDLSDEPLVDTEPEPEQAQVESTQRSRPPSSRRALTRALELAREAVQLDATNDHPEEAVAAYGRSVALLSEVMERVRRGETSDVTGRRKNGRRRSVVAQEEEVRRLQSIVSEKYLNIRLG